MMMMMMTMTATAEVGSCGFRCFGAEVVVSVGAPEGGGRRQVGGVSMLPGQVIEAAEGVGVAWAWV